MNGLTPAAVPGRARVALASARGSGALAVIQLTGPAAEGLLAAALTTSPPGPGEIRRADFRDPVGRLVDDVLVTQLTTTPPIYEITTHGGLRVVQRVIGVLRAAGAELAPAAELAAVTYGLADDVSRAAYRLLPQVRTAMAAEFLLRQAEAGLGELYRRIERGEAGREDLAAALRYWPAVRRLIEGFRVVLLGPANAGKSTLLNALMGREESLVSSQAGTTRDYVEAELAVGGLAVTFVDTAGLGPTGDPLASAAREKMLAAARSAEAALIVLDAAAEPSIESQFDLAAEVPGLRALVDSGRAAVVLNKIDLPRSAARREEFRGWAARMEKHAVSARTGENLPALDDLIVRLAGLAGFDPAQPAAFTAEQAADLARRRASPEARPS